MGEKVVGAPLGEKGGSGRRRFAWLAAGVLLVVAVFYLAAPFSVRVEPISLPGRLQTFPPTQDRVRAACSGPWRQLVSPPSIHISVDTAHDFTTVQHNRQPLCKNTGRSRALFSGWLLLAALALMIVVRPPRPRRPATKKAPQPDAGIVDLV